MRLAVSLGAQSGIRLASLYFQALPPWMHSLICPCVISLCRFWMQGLSASIDLAALAAASSPWWRLVLPSTTSMPASHHHLPKTTCYLTKLPRIEPTSPTTSAPLLIAATTVSITFMCQVHSWPGMAYIGLPSRQFLASIVLLYPQEPLLCKESSRQAHLPRLQWSHPPPWFHHCRANPRSILQFTLQGYFPWTHTPFPSLNSSSRISPPKALFPVTSIVAGIPVTMNRSVTAPKHNHAIKLNNIAMSS